MWLQICTERSICLITHIDFQWCLGYQFGNSTPVVGGHEDGWSGVSIIHHSKRTKETDLPAILTGRSRPSYRHSNPYETQVT